MSKTLITSRDPKGLQFMNLCAAVYDKAKLDEDRAQRLNENGGEFQDGLKKLIEQFSVTNQFADEEVKSNYTYPKEYQGPKLIGRQVDILAEMFNLSLGGTIEFIEKVLPTLALPDGAEGWFAIPSVEAVAKRFFPGITDPAERYCHAVNLVLEKIAASRKFFNYRAGQITPNRLRMHAHTSHALDLIAEQQHGDIFVIPAQFGLRHRGRSNRRAREVFTNIEFGLGAFAGGSMVLTHPERFIRWEQLHMDCPGDEFSPGAGGRFDHAPYLGFYDGKVKFYTGEVGYASAYYGSTSGFLPKKFVL